MSAKDDYPRTDDPVLMIEYRRQMWAEIDRLRAEVERLHDFAMVAIPRDPLGGTDTGLTVEDAWYDGQRACLAYLRGEAPCERCKGSGWDL